jgi:hypothetical protein
MTMTALIEGSATLELPDGTDRTVETAEGQPTVHRYFLDLVVVAASLTTPETTVASLAGEIISEYANRPGFHRSMLHDVEVAGAKTAAEFIMRWSASSGDEIFSTVRVAVGADFGVVLHATCPGQFADQYELVIRNIVESLRFSINEPGAMT